MDAVERPEGLRYNHYNGGVRILRRYLYTQEVQEHYFRRPKHLPGYEYYKGKTADPKIKLTSLIPPSTHERQERKN
jgi:hypothetical protein